MIVIWQDTRGCEIAWDTEAMIGVIRKGALLAAMREPRSAFTEARFQSDDEASAVLREIIERWIADEPSILSVNDFLSEVER